MGRCSTVASRRTTTTGPPGAMMRGPSARSCPTSAKWKPTWILAGTSTVPTVRSRYAAISGRSGCHIRVAFHQACLAADFRDDPDQNHPESTGVSPRARNTLDGVRISMALAYLDPARHRLNLTIKGNVMARRLLFEGRRAVGVEVESGGERFTVEADQIVLSSGAIGSPHLLLRSGVGPAAQLQSVGVPVLHDLPGVGQNLRDHPSATVLFRVAGERPDVQAPAIQVGLRYTVEGSYLQNDMQITPILMTSEHRPVQVRHQ